MKRNRKVIAFLLAVALIASIVPSFAVHVSAQATYSHLFPVRGGHFAYGYGSNPPGYGGSHNGVDIHKAHSGDYDTTIYAAASGTVGNLANVCQCHSAASNCPHYNTFGNYIRIDNDDGTYSYYGHLKYNSILVVKGQYVTAGTPIATIGDSGYATGEHLHYEVRSGTSSSNHIDANPINCDECPWEYSTRKCYGTKINYYFTGYNPNSIPYSSINAGNYNLINKANGKYLHVQNAGDSNGQLIEAGNSAFDAKADTFYIYAADDGYEMRPACSSSRVVNAWGNKPAVGAKVTLYDDLNNSTQWWKFEAVTDGYIIHLAYNTGLVLTQKDGEVSIETRTGASNQIWKLQFEHNHSYKTSWSANATQHWHECSVCSEKKDTANHSYDNDFDATCNICGYVRTLTAGKCGENVYWSLDSESGALTITGTGDMYNYDSAGAPWYNNRLAIKSVTIASGVTSIGDRAFEDCYNISSANLSNSITKIGEYSFEECVAVTSITIPDSVISIGEYAFVGILSLNEITIGNGVKSIDSGAFYKCENINKVYYKGTKSNWSAIEIADGNDCLTNAEIVILHITYDLNSTLSSVKGCAGETVKLTLSIDKNTLVKSGAVSFELPNGFTIVKGEWENSGPKYNDKGDSAINVISFITEDGKGVFTYDSSSYYVNGNIFELTVKIPESCADGVYGISYALQMATPQRTDLSVSHNYGAITVSRYTPGDIDGNDGLDANDAIYLLYHIYFSESYPVNQPCDFDGDGYETSDDAIYLLYHIYFKDSYPLH